MICSTARASCVRPWRRSRQKHCRLPVGGSWSRWHCQEDVGPVRIAKYMVSVWDREAPRHPHFQHVGQSLDAKNLNAPGMTRQYERRPHEEVGIHLDERLGYVLRECRMTWRMKGSQLSFYPVVRSRSRRRGRKSHRFTQRKLGSHLERTERTATNFSLLARRHFRRTQWLLRADDAPARSVTANMTESRTAPGGRAKRGNTKSRSAKRRKTKTFGEFHRTSPINVVRSHVGGGGTEEKGRKKVTGTCSGGERPRQMLERKLYGWNAEHLEGFDLLWVQHPSHALSFDNTTPHRSWIIRLKPATSLPQS